VKGLSDLLNLKNIIPINKNIIFREKLIKQLEENFKNKKLILVSAPAGYGKTTLISSWVTNFNKSTAWLTINEDDNDIKLFIQGIINAFITIDSKLFKNTTNLLQVANITGVKSILASFFTEIRKIDKEILLVLDDYHFIENNEINKILDKIINYLPTNIKIIISTREDPQLKLNRYRLAGIIYELRIRNLEFNYKEIEKFYEKAKIDIKENDLKRLAKRTEGWISGLKLAGLKLIKKDNENIHDFINEFAGSNYYIMDYLMEEVLKEIDEETKDFLYKTSVVEKFSPKLCNYLLDKNDSLNTLKKIKNMNLFLYELDSNKHWFRYHQLFRDLLSFHLDKNIKNNLHKKASKWFKENNLFKDAVVEAIKAKDNKLAVTYIEESIPYFLEKGEIKNLIELIERVPDQEILTSIPIMIIKAWLLFAIGKKKDALYYIELIEKNKRKIDDINKGRLYTLTSLIPEINNGEDPTVMAKNSIDLIDDNDYIFKINGWMSLGQIQASIGRLDESIHSFKIAYYLGRESGQSFLEIISLINLALKLNQKGKLQEAINLCQESIDRYTYSENQVDTLAKLIYIPKGIFLYQRGDYKSAKQLLIEGIEVSERLNLVHVAWMPKIYYSLTLFLEKENKKALEVINDLIDYTTRYNLNAYLSWAGSIKKEFNIKTGNLKLNENIEKKYEEKLKSNNDFNYKRYFFNYIRLLILNRKIEKAYKILKENEEIILSCYFIDKIRYYLFMTVVYQIKEDGKKESDYFKKVIKLIDSEPYLSIFIREGDLLLPLIRKYKKLNFDLLDKAEEYITKYLKGGKLVANEKLIEPLTDRELEILKLVSKGMSNKSIAEELFITLGTTKWHLSNMYSKLGVKSRTKATVKAKSLGIIKE